MTYELEGGVSFLLHKHPQLPGTPNSKMAGWSSQSVLVPNSPMASLGSTINSLGPARSRHSDVGMVIVPETPPVRRSDSDMDFCTTETLLNSLAYVNQELELLGLQCIPITSKQPSDLDPMFIINRLNEVLTLYHKTVAVKDELDTRNHRLSCDLEHQQSSYKRLKRSKEIVEREAQQDREKLRQINCKYKSMSGQIKADEEELRKLTAIQGSRDVQYKHEQKKKEKELNKLKERLHQLISDKAPDRKVGMDIMSLVGGSDGRRATWKTGPVKQEEEMYQVLVSNYEDSRQELMQENAELRDCLLSLQRELSVLLKRTGDMNASSVTEFSSHVNQSNSSQEEDDDDRDSLRSSRLSITELEDGYFQMPCDIMRNEIQQMFKDTCDQISNSMKKSLVRNISKASASSSRRMSQSPFSPSCEVPIPDRTERRTSSVSDTSEVERLKKQISNYKSIIEQQEDLIQQTLSSHSNSMESTFLHESQLLKDKENLAEQRKLFTEERTNFDKERKSFTDAAIRLAKEKKAFDSEKAAMLKQQFLNLSPFKGNSHRTAKAEGPSNRLLPATPVFSPAKCGQTTTLTSDHHLPTTVQLFKALGLTRDDTQLDTSPTTTITATPLPLHRQNSPRTPVKDSHSTPPDQADRSPSPSGQDNNLASPRVELIKDSLMKKHLDRSKSKD